MHSIYNNVAQTEKLQLFYLILLFLYFWFNNFFLKLRISHFQSQQQREYKYFAFGVKAACTKANRC